MRWFVGSLVGTRVNQQGSYTFMKAKQFERIICKWCRLDVTGTGFGHSLCKIIWAEFEGEKGTKSNV